MFDRFKEACRVGNLEEVQKLYKECPEDQRIEMLKARDLFGDYGAFRLASENGHLAIVEFLWENCPKDQRAEMLKASNYYAFRSAAENGHLEVVKFLWSICPEDQRAEMLKARDILDDYGAFRWASVNGHLEVVEFLWSICPEAKRAEMLKADNYCAFCYASTQRRFHVLDWLLSVADEKTKTEALKVLSKPEIALDMIDQRSEIKKKLPEFDVDEFNLHLTKLTTNSTLAKLLLTCKNLPEALKDSLQIMDMFAETANFIVRKKTFNSNILDAVDASQALINENSGLAMNSPEFFLKARSEKFGVSSEEDQYIHSGEGCSIL